LSLLPAGRFASFRMTGPYSIAKVGATIIFGIVSPFLFIPLTIYDGSKEDFLSKKAKIIGKTSNLINAML